MDTLVILTRSQNIRGRSNSISRNGITKMVNCIVLKPPLGLYRLDFQNQNLVYSSSSPTSGSLKMRCVVIDVAV